MYELQGRVKYYFNRIREEQTRAAFIPLIVILLLIIARLIYGPVDRNPVIIEFEGSEIVLKNTAGATVNRIEVGEAIVDHQSTGRNSVVSPLSVLVDIDDDGINELIYGTKVGNEISESYVRAWSVSGDSLVWEQEINFSYHYPRQLNIFEEGFQVMEIGIVNHQESPKIIFSATSNLYFQSLLSSIDAATGTIEETYLHPGRIQDVILIDLTEDNIEDMVFIGVNNAYWSAIAGMIQYDELGGYAPATSDYIPSNVPPVNQSHYTLLPRTIVGNYYSPIDKYNLGLRVYYDSTSEAITFLVRDGTHKFEDLDRGLELLFYFNKNFKPLGIGSSDTFDVIARRLSKEEKIPFEPDFEYFNSLQDSILYWTGEEFVPTQEYFKNKR
jgi:hypothetical protein